MSRFILISAAQEITRQAQLAATEAPDSLSADATLGAISRTASLAATEASDTLLADLAGAIVATVAKTEAPDTGSGAAALATAAVLARTEGTESASATATTLLQAALAGTEAVDALAASAAPVVGAALAQAEAGDLVAADATAASGGRTAFAALSEPFDVLQIECGVLVLVIAVPTEAWDSLGADAEQAVVVRGEARGRVQTSDRQEQKSGRAGQGGGRPERNQRGTRWAPRSSPRRR